MDYPKKAIGSENGPNQEQENETQIDAASPSSSVELSENGAYPCPTCPSVLTSSHELTNHLRGHNSPRTDCSGEEDYSCGVCNKVLSSASSLDRHVLVHSGERPFKCKYCKTSFTTNGNMNRHLRCTHRVMSPNSCSTGSEGSISSERPATTNEYNNDGYNDVARRNSSDFIDDQQQSSPNRANKRKCQDEDASDAEDQRRHKILMHNSRMTMKCGSEEEQNAFRCPICGKDFMSDATLESHMERIHPELPAKCDNCNTSFKNYRLLNHHRSTRSCKKNSDSNGRNLRNTVDGFNDLTFIDFSSIKFPTIARVVCERELHRPASGEANRFQCIKCLRAFPCKEAHVAHEKECKGPYKNKRNSNDNNNNNDSTNNNLEAELDIPSSQPDDHKTKCDFFFSVLDLQNNSTAHEPKEPRDSKEIKEPKETKDLADIPSILSVSLNGLQTFPRSDASTPENNIKFASNGGSSGSSGTCSSEFNEEEAQDAFTAEFRKMKLKGEFPCRLCASVFPNLRALKGHNRAHMNVEPGMPYPCNMCPFTSTDKGALLKHLRSHNGDRPFECSLCNYAFTTKANCERHVKNRHGMISKEDVKNVLIYHANEDPTNDNIERSSPRVVREEVRKALAYPNEREEAISYPPVPIDCNPGPSNVRTELLANRYEKTEVFPRPAKIQALNLVKRGAEEGSMCHDLVAKPNYSKVDEDVESGSSDGSVSLVSDTKEMHQRIQASPMNLTKTSPASSVLNTGEDGPLDLSMDVLDLSRKRKRENDDSGSQEEKRYKNNQELYDAKSALLLAQALLNSAHESSTSTSLESFYANTVYRNLNTLTNTGMIPSYFFRQHMFNQELTKGRLQKELVKGLQLTGGGTLPVDTSLPSTSYAAYSQTRDITPQILSEQNAYANLMSAQIATQVAPSREKTDSIASNDPVKMVLKNGVLIPKQKQRRYRTERPFGCEHCTARFTLRSNMERHIKQQHPQYWSQRPRGGHSTRGRPPASHPTLIQNPGPSTSQATQPYPNILSNIESPMTTSTNYTRHSISDQVKYAIIAQKCKLNKMDENDSDNEMVIDEESGDRDVQEQAQQESSTSLLRNQLESNECVKDIVIKTEVAEPVEETSEESRDEQTAQNSVDGTNSEESAAAESKLTRTEKTIMTEPTGREQSKLEDGTHDLASVSKLVDNASQQYPFKPQYISDEEGLMASTSGNNSGSEKSDSMNSMNSLNSTSTPTTNKKKKKKKKSAYSMAPNRVICPYCERQFPWTSSLRRHILTHTGQKPYQCMHCAHHFTTKSNCDRHLLRKHRAKANKMRRSRNSSSPDNQVIASNSNANNNNTFSMRNVPERPYKCNQCPSSTFSTLGNLKKHRSTKHRKTMSRSESSDQQNSPQQCSAQNDQSDYESRSSSLSENMENSSPATTATAKSNSNTSSSMNDTSRSRKSPRSSPGPGDVPFKCYLCDSGFSERQDCLDHIKMHHKRSYEMLKAKGALEMASMNADAASEMSAGQQHPSDGEEKKGRFPDYSNRKVVCAFCMRRFWSAEDLRRHMRTHTGERPFECNICTRKFTLKHSMLRHRKKHESVDSAMYVGNSGDEDNHPPTQPPTITPRCQQHSPISTNTSRPRTQDRISLPTVAAVATADAAPRALMRYSHYDNMATLTGRMANDGSQNAASVPLHTTSPPPPTEAPSESGDNDLISNLLGIHEKGLLDKVLLSSADDAAKLLGVNHSE